jgi:hypothetical protein
MLRHNDAFWLIVCMFQMDSLGKLDKILELCYRLGVETKPKMINGVGIIPLYSWYHQANFQLSPLSSFACTFEKYGNKFPESLYFS